MFDASNSKFVSIEDFVDFEQQNQVSPSVLSKFKNESSALVNYLTGQAHTESKLSVSKTFVLVTLNYSEVLGFFSISTTSIHRQDFRSHGMPYLIVPAALIGRLGRNSNYLKKGIGEILLFESLKQIVSIADMIGIKVIVTDAKDQNAMKFYQRYGFKNVKNQVAGNFPFRMYLIIDTAKEAVANY